MSLGSVTPRCLLAITNSSMVDDSPLWCLRWAFCISERTWRLWIFWTKSFSAMLDDFELLLEDLMTDLLRSCCTPVAALGSHSLRISVLVFRSNRAVRLDLPSHPSCDLISISMAHTESKDPSRRSVPEKPRLIWSMSYPAASAEPGSLREVPDDNACRNIVRNSTVWWHFRLILCSTALYYRIQNIGCPWWLSDHLLVLPFKIKLAWQFKYRRINALTSKVDSSMMG